MAGSSSIQVICAACGCSCKAPPRLRGHVRPCPKCGESCRIPEIAEGPLELDCPLPNATTTEYRQLLKNAFAVGAHNALFHQAAGDLKSARRDVKDALRCIRNIRMFICHLADADSTVSQDSSVFEVEDRLRNVAEATSATGVVDRTSRKAARRRARAWQREQRTKGRHDAIEPTMALSQEAIEKLVKLRRQLIVADAAVADASKTAS